MLQGRGVHVSVHELEWTLQGRGVHVSVHELTVAGVRVFILEHRSDVSCS